MSYRYEFSDIERWARAIVAMSLATIELGEAQRFAKAVLAAGLPQLRMEYEALEARLTITERNMAELKAQVDAHGAALKEYARVIDEAREAGVIR